MDTELPEWVHWLAQDADGQWWGYEVEPNMKHDGWYENELGRYIKLHSTCGSSDWAKSLTSVSSKVRSNH